MSVVVTLPQAKSSGNFQSTDNDGDLQRTIDNAERMIARKVGPLAPTAVTERVPGCRATLVLSTFPFVSLTSLTDSSSATTNVSLLHLDRSGVVTYSSPWSSFYMPWYDVVYQAGWADNTAFFEPVLELTRHLWKPRMGNSVRGTTNNEGTPAPFALPNRVMEMLDPYIPLPD